MSEKTHGTPEQVHEQTPEREIASPEAAASQHHPVYASGGDGLTPNQRAVLRMQQTQGNAAVRRRLGQGIVQRDSPPNAPAATAVTTANAPNVPSALVATAGMTNQASTPQEGAANGQLGGADDIRDGINVLSTHNIGQVLQALADQLNTGNQGDATRHRAQIVSRVQQTPVLNFVGEIWYVANELVRLDRAGHIVPGTFHYDFNVTSLQPGTYFYGTFLTQQNETTEHNSMIRLDGQPSVVSGDVGARSVTQDFIPARQAGQAIIDAHHGIAIVVSPHIAHEQRQHGISYQNLWRALQGVPTLIPWAVRSELANMPHELSQMGDVLVQQALSHAQAQITRFVGAPAQIVTAMQSGYEFGQELAIAQGEHATADEINIASQAIARRIAQAMIARVQHAALNAHRRLPNPNGGRADLPDRQPIGNPERAESETQQSATPSRLNVRSGTPALSSGQPQQPTSGGITIPTTRPASSTQST